MTAINFSRRTIATACIGTLLLPGCLTRTEKIVVARNGAVTYHVGLNGKPEDFKTRAWLPSPESGWKTTTRITETDDGEEHEVSATRQFAPGEALPGNFAPASHAASDLPLTFPTTVIVESTHDQKTLVFQRRYEPRTWRPVHFWNERFLESDRIKELSEKDQQTLTESESYEIIKAFANTEAHKQLEYAHNAARSINLDIPIIEGLVARDALLNAYSDDTIKAIMDQCRQLDEDLRDDCFSQQGDALIKQGLATYRDALQEELQLSTEMIDRWTNACENERTRYGVTEALGGHGFGIEVVMPGAPLGSNADEVELAENQTTFRWEFDGKVFRDRVHRLEAATTLSEPAD